MSTQLQLRRGNTAQTAVFTGAVAEVTVDTEKNVVVVHDGVTVGGYPSITVDTLNSANTFLQANDALTLSAAEGYTDTANTKLKSYVDTSILTEHDYSSAAFTKANTAAFNITNIQNVNLTQNSRIQYAETNSNSAYTQANTGTTLAQTAFNAGNTTLTYAEASYTKANADGVLAQAAFDAANNSLSGTATDGWARTQANAAFSSGNTTNTYAQSAYGKANSANVLAQAAYTQANTGTTLAQASFDAGNTTNTYAQSGYTKANSANVLAQSAYTQANTGTTLAQDAFDAGNTTNTYAVSAYSQANTNAGAITVIEGVNTTQNTNISAADAKAQAAYNTANTKFNSAGGTITGDTVVTGNLTVSGTTLYANVTNIVVEDNIITLNSNVTGTPTQNAGIEVNRGSSTNTSVIWNENHTAWELTNDGTTFDKITTNSVLAANVSYLQGIEDSQNTYSQAAYSQANTNAGAITVIQSVNTTQNTNISSADSKAQAAYTQANTGTTLAQASFDAGNTTNTYAQSGYAKANTNADAITVIQSVDNTQNSVISAVVTDAAAAFIKANAAFTSSNTVGDYATSGYAKANSATTLAQASFDAGNTTTTYAQSAYAKANSANVFAQSVYDSSNTKFSSSGGTISGDVIVTGHANVNSYLVVGTGAPAILPNLIAQFTGTSDLYSQVNNQNLDANGTSDVVITADNGTDLINYLDMGFAGSNYKNTNYNSWSFVNPNDGYLMIQGNAGQSFGGNLYIGTAGSGAAGTDKGDIVFIQGNDTHEVARFVLGQGLTVNQSLHAGSVYDNGVRITTYVDTANTFLQANDATTLASAKSYTDSANTNLKSYVDGQISSTISTVESYTDTANTKMKSYVDNGLSTTLSTAEGYTDTANTKLKSYVDGQVITINSNISANLSTAEGYTDTANTKMKSYVDTANTSMKSYVDTANTSLKSYVDGQVITINSNISANLTTAEGYTDTANTKMKSYVDAANTSLKSYVDGQIVVVQGEISSNLATAEGYTDTANTKMKSYVDNSVSTANTSLKSYVDGQVITINSNISANLSTAEGYTDTANTKLKSYMDGQIVVVQGEIASNLSTAETYTDTANTKLKSYVDTNFYNKSGTVSITDSTQSTGDGSGALTVSGGVGIAKNLNVGGSAVITGDLTVHGTQYVTSTETTQYSNPVVSLHTPADGGWLVNNDGCDIGITWEYYSPITPGARIIVGGSGNGTTATLSVSDGTYYPVGSVVTVSDVTPSGFNGVYVVTATSVGSFSYLNSTTGSVNATGNLGSVHRNTEFVVNGGSSTGGEANVTFDSTFSSIVMPVGSTITLTGNLPTDYNGTYTIDSSGPGWLTYNVGGNPGNITSPGKVVFQERHGFLGFTNDEQAFEFYKVGDFTNSNTFAGLYGTIRSGFNEIFPNQSQKATDIQSGFLRVYDSYVYDVTSLPSATLNDAITVDIGQMTYDSANTGVSYHNASTMYIKGAPLVGNNIVLTGNTYALEIASGNTYFGGNVLIGISQAVVFNDGSRQYTAGAPYAYANASYALANSTTTYAQSAYAKANNAGTVAQASFDAGNTTNAYAVSGYAKANTSGVVAQSAYDSGNTTLVYAQSAYASGNTTLTYAQAAYTKANADGVLAQAAFDSSNSVSSLNASINATQNTNISAVTTTAQAAFNSGNTTLTYATSGYTKANSAFDKANSATTLAQASFDAGNTTNAYAVAGYGQANTGTTLAQAAFSAGNTTNTYATSGYNKANSANVLAQSAYTQANTGTTIAQAAFDSGNTTLTYAQAGYAKANADGVLAQAAFDSGNTTLTYATAGFNKANASVQTITAAGPVGSQRISTTGTTDITLDLATVYGLSAGTYSYPTLQVDSYGRVVTISNNTPVTSWNGMTGAVTLSSANVTSALGYTPATSTLAQAAFDSGNTTLVYAQSGYAKANSGTALAQSAFDSGNITLTYAQSAYTSSNGKFSSSGGTISGDTVVTGNLTVTGTRFYANTVSLVVEDNIITINSNVTGTPTLNAGIEVNRGSSTNTSLLWNETDKAWEFTNDGSVYEKIAASSYANAAYSQANTSGIVAQAAFDKANSATTLAQASFNAGNTTLTYAQAAFNIANTDVTNISTTAGIYGSTSVIPVVTLAANGRVSTITNTSIAITSSQVSGLATSATTDTTNANNISTGTLNVSRLPTSGVSAGTYGGATQIPVITIDTYGRATVAANVALNAGATITDDTTTATTHYPLLAITNTGTLSVANTSSTKLTYVPSTGTLTTVDLNTTSDAQFKENVEPIVSPLDVLNNIDGVSFNWKDSGNKSYGVIAQELQKVLPELVKQGDYGLSVSYIPLIAILIEAVKEQQKQIDELKNK